MAKYRTINHYLDEPLLAELDRQIEFGRQQSRGEGPAKHYVRQNLYSDMPMHAMYESAASPNKPSLKIVQNPNEHKKAAN